MRSRPSFQSIGKMKILRIAMTKDMGESPGDLDLTMDTGYEHISLQEAQSKGLIPSYKDPVDQEGLDEALRWALHTLTPREEEILRRYYGLGGHQRESMQTISDDFQVTRSRIMQIKNKAIHKLKHPSRNRRLRPFL